MSNFDPAEKLRQHRPLLLACEAIGWLHMAGKARLKFLRKHGGVKEDYDDLKWHDSEQPPFPWDDLLGWVKEFSGSVIKPNAWPSSIKEFTEKHRERDSDILGLLQAGHGIASGIEKNLPTKTSEYLSQYLCKMWLSTPFGYPKRNLFDDPPEILTENGWKRLVEKMNRVLEELKALASQKAADVSRWRQWRDMAIGPASYIRKAFLSTLAETRLPNNDVTLWDQSYVAAALFKSAVAGAILNSSSFPWNDRRVKQKIRWRLLTVAIGTDHYEARAVKIGDWTGSLAGLDQFFDEVAHLIEVDLAMGSLIYRDRGIAVFSFPGEQFNEKVPALWLNGWEYYLQQEVDRIAKSLYLETPPLLRLSLPTRSLVPIVRERREVNEALVIPVHRPWNVCPPNPKENYGHICPVCRIRLNGDPTNKEKPCEVCQKRRYRRLKDWLRGQMSCDTIWFEEVADRNNRLALITLFLDLEPWLNGERVDSLRAQAIPEWIRFNPILSNEENPIKTNRPWENLHEYIKNKFQSWNSNDPVLTSLQEGFKYHKGWQEFFERVVEDRADAPDWKSLNDEQRATWLAHQLFRKLPSPGRVYRFWREAQEFFEHLLKEFRRIADSSENPWRVRRLLVVPDQGRSDQGWKDSTLYDGRLRGVQFSLLYLQALNGFITTSNLAQVLGPEEQASALASQSVFVAEEDIFGNTQNLIIKWVEEIPSSYYYLRTYHPLIPLELSPLRFRVVVPLEVVSECVDLAQSLWEKQFSMVWDRLPLHVGVVAFERALSFQAVLEATRNLEDTLSSQNEECWEVIGREAYDDSLMLQLRHQDVQMTTPMMPLRMPDGREDVFYPYLRVEDQKLRFPKDFRHPKGAVYRHVADLQIGDRVYVCPALVATLFMDSTSVRFEKIKLIYANDWKKLRALWQLIRRVAPSQTALQRFWSELNRLESEWLFGTEKPSVELWKDTIRALLAQHLEVKGVDLETLSEAALRGLLQRTLEWHITALKESL